MARSRMIDVDFINNDNFCELSDKAQLLYIRLMLASDDDGLCGKPKQVMRTMGASKKQLDELLAAGYIHIFDSGVCLIMDWCIHNHIQPSRHRKESLYSKELAQIEKLKTVRKTIKTKEGKEETREEIQYSRYKLREQQQHKAEMEHDQVKEVDSQTTYGNEPESDEELPWN